MADVSTEDGTYIELDLLPRLICELVLGTRAELRVLPDALDLVVINGRIKVKEPELFDSTKSKYNAYITTVRLQFCLHADKFKHEDDKVLYAAVYLKGQP